VTLGYEERLAVDEVRRGRAQVRDLAQAGILTTHEANAVMVALDRVDAEPSSGDSAFEAPDELTTAPRRRDADLTRFVRTMVGFGIASLTWYVLVLWDFAVDPLRTAISGGVFSNFYDIQARALLDGHLDVPRGTLGIEAFVIDGRHLMYFPPGPSLLRIPLFLVTDRFDGRLTAVSMLLAATMTVLLVSLLLWRVRRILRGDAPLGVWEAAGHGAVLVAATSGSVMLFLASMPWVYHEAYAWAIAMAIGFAYSLLGVIERPSTGRVVAAGLFALGAILSRTTAGWACALAALATAAWFLLGREGTVAKRHWWKLLPAALVPLSIGSAVNWAKFHHPYMFPLQDQLWTRMSVQRRLALAANGGDLVDGRIFFSTAANYFRPNGIRFVPIFPYVTLPADVARSYGGGFLDQTYRTGSVPAFMPLLFLLGMIGLIVAFWRRDLAGARLLRIPLIGAGAIPVGIMFYGYITYRYTSDFLPVLVVATAGGVVMVSRWVATRPRLLRSGILGGIALLAAFGVAANTAVAFHANRVANPGPLLRDYVITQEKLSEQTGNPLDDFVSIGGSLPRLGPADDLRIIGSCRSWYIGTADPQSPWNVIEARHVAIAGEIVDDGRPLDFEGEVVLAQFVGFNTRQLVLERRGARAFRLRLGAEMLGVWHVGTANSTFVVSIRPDPVRDQFVVQGPGLMPHALPMTQLGKNLLRKPVLVEPIFERRAVKSEGLRLRALPTSRLRWCERVLARHHGTSNST
jgi:hypothetical protein